MDLALTKQYCWRGRWWNRASCGSSPIRTESLRFFSTEVGATFVGLLHSCTLIRVTLSVWVESSTVTGMMARYRACRVPSRSQETVPMVGSGGVFVVQVICAHADTSSEA